MILDLARILHVFGVLLWVGGMATGSAAAMSLSSKPQAQRAPGMDAVRHALRILATPGLLLAWLGGLAMLVSNWSAVYAHAGWAHGKLTIGILLSGLHGVLLARTRPGRATTARPFVIALALTLLFALMNVVLVVVRPGS